MTAGPFMDYFESVQARQSLYFAFDYEPALAVGSILTVNGLQYRITEKTEHARPRWERPRWALVAEPVPTPVHNPAPPRVGRLSRWERIKRRFQEGWFLD